MKTRQSNFCYHCFKTVGALPSETASIMVLITFSSATFWLYLVITRTFFASSECSKLTENFKKF